MTHFDTRLKGLYDQYLQTIVYKYAQELYMSRLAIAVQEREDASIHEEKLLTQLDELCDVRDAAVGKHETFMNKFDDFRRNVENMIVRWRVVVVVAVAVHVVSFLRPRAIPVRVGTAMWLTMHRRATIASRARPRTSKWRRTSATT